MQRSQTASPCGRIRTPSNVLEEIGSIAQKGKPEVGITLLKSGARSYLAGLTTEQAAALNAVNKAGLDTLGSYLHSGAAAFLGAGGVGAALSTVGGNFRAGRCGDGRVSSGYYRPLGRKPESPPRRPYSCFFSAGRP